MFNGFNSSYMQMTSNLVRLGVELQNSNARLATGKRINKGSDDPAGLVAATALNKEISSLDAQMRSAERLKAVVDTADGALGEISSLLTEIETAVIASAGNTLTDGEKAAYQSQIDDAVNAIDRLVNTTTHNGSRLLDGTLGYTSSGANSSEVTDIRIRQASSSNTAAIVVSKSRTETAATLEILSAVPTGDIDFTVTGNDGTSTSFGYSAGKALSEIQDEINLQTGDTGVNAILSGNGSLYLTSSGDGSDDFVSVSITDGESDFTITGTSASSYGTTTDTVTANGRALNQDTEGTYTYSDSQTNVTFNLVDSFTGTTSFSVSGQGAGWSLNGSEIKFGISDMSSSKLGNVNLGYLSSLKSGGTNDINSGNSSTAQSIISEAHTTVNTERGYLGSISKYTIDSSVNSWQKTKESLSSAYSSIMDLDYAVESANNSRIQSLLNVQTQVMGNMYNFTGNMVKTLLGY